MNSNRIINNKQATLLNIIKDTLNKDLSLKDKQKEIEKKIQSEIQKSPLPFLANLNNKTIDESKNELYNYASIILEKSRLPKPMETFMNPELLTVITLRVLINLFHTISEKSSKISRISLIRAIADLILRQLAWEQEQLNFNSKEKEKTYIGLEKTYNKYQQELSDKTETTSKTLAAKIVECLSKANITIEHIETKTFKKSIKTTKYFQLSESWAQIAAQAIDSRTKLPMISKPKPWELPIQGVDNNITGVNLQKGGYLYSTNLDKTTALLSNLSCIYRVYHTQESCNAINYLQSIPFCLDKDLLDYMKKNPSLIPKYAAYKKIISVPKITYSSINDKMDYKLGEVYDSALNYVSNVDYSLEIASILLDINLFFPINHDGRGRLYPIAFPITPTSHNYIRSLLRVPESYEFTKASYPNEWNTFISSITKSVLGENTKKAISQFKKNPVKAFKKIDQETQIKDFSLLIKKNLFLQGGGETSQLIGLDVTASGLQIMGIGTRDLKALKLTNVFQDTLDEYSEKDIYRKIHDRVVKSYPIVENFSRKEYKSIIMRLSYGEGNFSRKKTLSNYFQENPIKELEELNYQSRSTLLYNLAKEYDTVLYEEFPKFKIFKLQVEAIVRLKIKLNMPICLKVSPHLSSTQYYTEDKATTYSFRDHNGKPKRVKMFIPTKLNSSKESRFEAKPKANKMLKATLPNLIHHIDSLIVHKIVLKFQEQNKPIFTIHDAFYVRLIDTTFLKEIYFNELHLIHNYNFWQAFLLSNTIDLNKNEYTHITKKQRSISEELNTLINDVFLPESQETKLSLIDFTRPMSPNILS